jgi:hypothetical protein
MTGVFERSCSSLGSRLRTGRPWSWSASADDFAAGVSAWAALQAALWLAPAWLS